VHGLLHRRFRLCLRIEIVAHARNTVAHRRKE
jgi:hypothetical protein